MNKDQTLSKNSQCCIDYCTTDFKTEESVVVNHYKCKTRKLSAADMWLIEKNRKSLYK